MDYLIISPPVITPGEPSAGAFLLASGLKARGIDAAFFDMSTTFFHRIFNDVPRQRGYPDPKPAITYLQNNTSYTLQEHRTALGILHSSLKIFSYGFDGWKISLMDIVPPDYSHQPTALGRLLKAQANPFSKLWEDELLPILLKYKPRKILVSLSYLSQLPAGIDLVRFAEANGFSTLTGGSLISSLRHSGKNAELLHKVFPAISENGAFDIPEVSDKAPFLSNIVFPDIIHEWNYLTGRTVIPYALSTGCFWNKCLFCPDRSYKYQPYGQDTFMKFIDSLPDTIRNDNPIIHFIDSAIPMGSIRKLLPSLKNNKIKFYGFARPDEHLLALIPELSSSGCLMIQLGIESGSRRLLDKYKKGIDPDISLQILKESANAGIRNYVYLLAGLPGENDNDLSKTERLMTDAGKSVDYLNLSVFNLPYKCEMSDSMAEFDMEPLDTGLPDDSFQFYLPFTVKGENLRKTAKDFYSNRLMNISSVADAAANTPKWFRTAHMALMELPGRTKP